MRLRRFSEKGAPDRSLVVRITPRRRGMAEPNVSNQRRMHYSLVDFGVLHTIHMD